MIVTGRLSVRDDEDIKLLADTVEPLGEKTQKDPRTDAQIARDAQVKLYLRLKREEMSLVQDVLSAMKGDEPVYINLPEENITLLAPRSMWVRDAQYARTLLLDEIGGENIRLVEKPVSP